mmetsp:Transcript_14918/g.52354  ORF Transcript_14918/g.52354 Transcript_14918/m.52354 type:complete len:255 (+) Transcript_14918:480-1244(+)
MSLDLVIPEFGRRPQAAVGAQNLGIFQCRHCFDCPSLQAVDRLLIGAAVGFVCLVRRRGAHDHIAVSRRPNNHPFRELRGHHLKNVFHFDVCVEDEELTFPWRHMEGRLAAAQPHGLQLIAPEARAVYDAARRHGLGLGRGGGLLQRLHQQLSRLAAPINRQRALADAYAPHTVLPFDGSDLCRQPQFRTVAPGGLRVTDGNQKGLHHSLVWAHHCPQGCRRKGRFQVSQLLCVHSVRVRVTCVDVLLKHCVQR